MLKQHLNVCLCQETGKGENPIGRTLTAVEVSPSSDPHWWSSVGALCFIKPYQGLIPCLLTEEEEEEEEEEELRQVRGGVKAGTREVDMLVSVMVTADDLL